MTSKKQLAILERKLTRLRKSRSIGQMALIVIITSLSLFSLLDWFGVI